MTVTASPRWPGDWKRLVREWTPGLAVTLGGKGEHAAGSVAAAVGIYLPRASSVQSRNALWLPHGSCFWSSSLSEETPSLPAG